MATFEKTFNATSIEQINKIFTESLPVYTSLVVEDDNNEYGTFKITIKYSDELTVIKDFTKNGQSVSIETGFILYTYNGKSNFTINDITLIAPFSISITFYSTYFNEESYPSQEVLYRRDKTRQNFIPFKWEDIPEGEDQIQILITNLVNMFYPVGSIYISTSNKLQENPILNIGSWQEINDTFLIAAGSDFQALNSQEYDTKNSVGPIGGSTDIVLPIHQHQIKGYGTETISLKHSHTPAIRTNTNYTYKDYGGWVGVVPNNNCTTSQAKSVANSGIGQQGYVTTNQASTPNKSFPYSPYAANLIDFFWGNDTNTVDTSHKHDLPTMITNSIVGYGENENGGKLVEEEDLKNTNIPPYLPVYMWRRKS